MGWDRWRRLSGLALVGAAVRHLRTRAPRAAEAAKVAGVKVADAGALVGETAQAIVEGQSEAKDRPA